MNRDLNHTQPDESRTKFKKEMKTKPNQNKNRSLQKTNKKKKFN